MSNVYLSSQAQKIEFEITTNAEVKPLVEQSTAEEIQKILSIKFNGLVNSETKNLIIAQYTQKYSNIGLKKLKALLSRFFEDVYSLSTSYLESIIKSSQNLKKGANDDNVFLKKVAIFSNTNLEIIPENNFELGRYSLDITSIASAYKIAGELLRDTSIFSDMVVEEPGTDLLIKEGILKIRVPNNRLISSISASSPADPIVVTDDINDKFEAGSFELNGQVISLENGDNLNKIADKINIAFKNKKNPILARPEQRESDKFILVLYSKILGIENRPIIKNINKNIFEKKMKLEDRPSDIPEDQFLNIPLYSGMNLAEVIKTISESKYDNQSVIKMEIQEDQLILSSMISGVGNELDITNFNEVIGNLFPASSSIVTPATNCELTINKIKYYFKSNTLNLDSGGLHANIKIFGLEQNQIFNITPHYNFIIDKVESFFLTYYRLVSFFGNYHYTSNFNHPHYKSINKEEIKFNYFLNKLLIDEITKGKLKNLGIDISVNSDNLEKYAPSWHKGAALNEIKSIQDIPHSFMTYQQDLFMEKLKESTNEVRNLFVGGAQNLEILISDHDRNKIIKRLAPIQNDKIADAEIKFHVDFNIGRAKLKSSISRDIRDDFIFRKGKILINKVIIKVDKNLYKEDFVNLINEKKSQTGINLNIYNNKLIFKKNSPGAQWPPEIFDIDGNVLNDIFDIDKNLYSSTKFNNKDDIAVNPIIGPIDPNLFNAGEFFINGRKIKINQSDTWDVISKKISKPNSEIEAHITYLGTSLQLELLAKRSSTVNFIDKDNILNNVFTYNYPDRGDIFFDSIDVAKIKMEPNIYNRNSIKSLLRLDNATKLNPSNFSKGYLISILCTDIDSIYEVINIIVFDNQRKSNFEKNGAEYIGMVEFINYNTNLYLEEINQEYIQGFKDLYEALKEELEADIKNFDEIEYRKIQKLIQHEQSSFDPTTLLQ